MNKNVSVSLLFAAAAGLSMFSGVASAKACSPYPGGGCTNGPSYPWPTPAPAPAPAPKSS